MEYQRYAFVRLLIKVVTTSLCVTYPPVRKLYRSVTLGSDHVGGSAAQKAPTFPIASGAIYGR
jgi:hypothetical protein